jgi:hypothetical protein
MAMVLTPACFVRNSLKMVQVEAQYPSVTMTMFSGLNFGGPEIFARGP